MNTRPTAKQIGSRVMELRKGKGLSQEDLATYLGIGRSSVAQVELGNRNLSVVELIKLSDVLGISLDRFFVNEDLPIDKEAKEGRSTTMTKTMRVAVPKLSAEKLKNVLLYILERCAGKPNVGETVLYKLLYFADFNYYEKYEEHLTGARYRKLPFGPVPTNLENIIDRMLESGKLQRIKTDYHGYPQTRYLPLEKPDLTKMSAAEKEVIDQVIELYSDWSAAMISDYSHNDKPWRATEQNEWIDYELVFYRRPPYSVRVYEEDENTAV